MPELPYEIWKDRINNEINILKHSNLIEKDSISWSENNVEFWINIRALGFIQDHSKEGITLIPKNSHRINLKLNRNFPYPGGIDFSWNSNIFHPNIHPIDIPNLKESGTGYICLNVLKKWSRLSDLETTIKALKSLAENPNPDDPLNYDLCLKAAEYFKKHSIELLKETYKDDNQGNDDNDIRIL
ncbi:MAG: ubiquitin-conjugating enzyme E2, partial [Candidatus Thorarchaeota archaeon]